MLDALQQRYKLSVSFLRKAGDEMTFLKRKHLLVRDDLLIMQPLHKHFQRLVDLISCDYIGSTPRKAPMPTGKLPTETHTDPLDEDRSQRYRSATGLLLYLAPDIVQAQYGIRLLSQFMASPTTGSWKLLKHMVSYLWGARGYCVGFEKPFPGTGLVAHGSKQLLLEILSDADWAGDPQTRRSVSSCVILLNNQILHSSSRVQKAVSLSSGESEFYASVSAAADGLYLKAG